MLDVREKLMGSIAGKRVPAPRAATLLIVDIEDVTAATASAVRRVLNGSGRRRRSGIALGGTIEALPSSCSDIIAIDAAGFAIEQAVKVMPGHGDAFDPGRKSARNTQRCQLAELVFINPGRVIAEQAVDTFKQLTGGRDIFALEMAHEQ